MTPYYSDSDVTIYHADMRDLAQEFECAAVVTDPPYGDTSLNWDVHTGWLDAIPACKGGCWFFASLKALLRTDFAGWTLAQEVVWEKHNGSSFHADRFKRVHEYAVHVYQGAWADVAKNPVKVLGATPKTVRRKNRPPHTGDSGAGHYVSEDGGPKLERSVIRVRSCHGYARHPTQKPVGILAPLIEYSTRPRDTVLDPFMGSGSTLEACRMLGRRAIGIEREERYCRIAADRLRQCSIFAAGGGMTS